jgi:enoyl-CoA hydratase/carnithine racemase
MTRKKPRNVSIERHGRVAIVRFDRSDGKNALSFETLRELTVAARSFEDDPDISAIVLTGTPSVFTVGFDLKDSETTGLANLGLAERRKLLETGPRLCRAWESLEPMTIAAVEGWCIGGGMSITLSCDLRVAGEGASSFAPEIERGMNMSWQTIPRAVALVGPARAKRLFVMAERLSAGQGLDWGYYDAVAPGGGALQRAMEMAERIAAMPPVQVRMVKQGVNAAAFALADAVSVLDRDQYLLAQGSEDYEEGLRSFLEKRPPKYTGR